MRSLLVVVLLLVVSPAPAADKEENKAKAKEAAVAFMKAIKAKDLEALMKTVGVPFLMLDNRGSRTIEKADELKAELKAKLERLKNTDGVPTELGDVLDRAAVRKLAKGKDDEKIIALIEKAIGEDGYWVEVGKKDGPKTTFVLVRITDGKALVVGTPG